MNEPIKQRQSTSTLRTLMNACSHTEVTPKYQKICGELLSTAVPRCRVLWGSKNGVNMSKREPYFKACREVPLSASHHILYTDTTQHWVNYQHYYKVASSHHSCYQQHFVSAYAFFFFSFPGYRSFLHTDRASLDQVLQRFTRCSRYSLKEPKNLKMSKTISGHLYLEGVCARRRNRCISSIEF